MEHFVQKHLELLKAERDAEIQQTRLLHETSSAAELQKSGQCIPKLQISSHCTGLYGRTVVAFERSVSLAPNQQLPSHSITNGDIVGISLCSAPITDVCASGVIVRVSKTTISIAVDGVNDSTLDWQNVVLYNIVKLANDVTYRRIKICLESLHRAPQTQLIDVLFGDRKPDEPLSKLSYPDGKSTKLVNQKLNESQMEAVDFALRQKDVAMIHGPPGTGKTTTVVEVIMQAILSKQKVLACAPSNIAVDNLVEKLADNQVSVVRLGHPARAMRGIQKYSLDAVLMASCDSQIVKSVRSDIDSSLVKLRKTKKIGERKSIQQELKELKRELRDREKRAITQVLSRADVILSTLTSASPAGPLKHLDSDHFDLVVIDECSQAIEAACWIALAHARKCVLAGDHMQLPPTILSEEAANGGLSLSLMERVLNMFEANPEGVLRMLTVQYRMNENIMAWSSRKFYDNRLKADPSVRSHLLRDLKDVADNEDTNIPLLLIDTAGCDLYELDLVEEMSKANEGEADLVALHVQKLISSGVPASDIGVISPYNLQVECIRLRLQEKHPKLEIKSVDSFQGREKEAIVISLVRSNSNGQIGFLAEHRRINVAITRARRHLAIICDSETMSRDESLKSLVEYMADNGELRTALCYTEELGSMMQVRPKSLKFRADGQKMKKSKPKSNSACGHRPLGLDKSNREAASESRNDAVRQRLEAQIDEFISHPGKDAQELTSELSSYERMIVHQYCEKMKLSHASIGEGAERRIVLSKSPKPVSDCLMSSAAEVVPVREIETANVFESAPLALNDGAEDPDDPECEMESTCSHCRKMIPRSNLALHELHCRRIFNSSFQKIGKHKSKIKPVTKSLDAQLASASEDDIEGLLAAARCIDNICTYVKCKAKMSTLGQKCRHCARMFCLTHGMPEIHGCGLTAKMEARQKMRKDMATKLNANALSVKGKDSRVGIERKLDKKLQEMANERKGLHKGK